MLFIPANVPVELTKSRAYKSLSSAFGLRLIAVTLCVRERRRFFGYDQVERLLSQARLDSVGGMDTKLPVIAHDQSELGILEVS